MLTRLLFSPFAGLWASSDHAERRVAWPLGAVLEYVVDPRRKDQKPCQNVGRDLIYLGGNGQQLRSRSCFVEILRWFAMWRRPLRAAELWPTAFEGVQETASGAQGWPGADLLEARSLLGGSAATSKGGVNARIC